MVVVDADALEKGTGLLEEDVRVLDGFFREEREGGGGRIT